MKRIRLIVGGTVVAALVAGAAWWVGLGGAHATSAVQSASRPVAAAVVRPVSAAPVVAQSAEPLTKGCNLLTLTNLTVGGKVSDYIAQHISPADAVVGVWHFDNASQRYQASYFADSRVPIDQPTITAAIDAYFICVSADATSS